MLTRMLGALAGSHLAKKSSKIGGTGGALLGAGAAMVAKRASLPLLAAVVAGGYLLKRSQDRRDAEAGPTQPKSV